MANPKINLYPTNEVQFNINIAAGQAGPIGPTGLTPQITIDNTITGGPYTNAEVSISGTAENPALTFIIPQGNPFVIAVEYPTINDLENNTNSIPTSYVPSNFDFAIITSDQGVEDPDNAKLFIFDDGPFGGWSFVSDLSGATGPRRELRWKPDGQGGLLSILQWKKDDGTWDEENERDLGLSFSFSIIDNVLRLNIENAEGLLGWVDLTTTAEFGNGTNATVTSIKFVNNNATATNFQELGVYASFDGTELVLENPDTTEVRQELSLDFDWDETQLGIKTPTDQDFTYQKLSPDISFQTENGISVSVVEPNTTENLIKISPDISFRNVGNGLELSIVEPNASQVFNKISPDIVWDGTNLAVVEPGATPQSSDYVNLKGETGDIADVGSPLFKIRDEEDTISNGLQVGVQDEIQFKGNGGVEVLRINEIFSINLIAIDGGEFDEN